MGVNKVVFGDVPIMDISDSTITEDAVVEGSIGYGADGEQITGTNPYKKAETDAEVTTQEELMGQILAALEGKSAGGGIDTSSDNPVTASDMVAGKEAFVNGEMVVGTLQEKFPTIQNPSASYYTSQSLGMNFNWIKIVSTSTEDAIIRSGDEISVSVSATDFGDAFEADVVAGKTFTSSRGLKLKGTATIGGGVDTSSDVPATSNDITGGKEAFVNGEKVIGSLRQTYAGAYDWSLLEVEGLYGESLVQGTIELETSVTDDVIARKGSYLGIRLPRSEFGDAKREDVAKGVFFTSSEGFNIEGTAEPSSGSALVTKQGTTTTASFDTGLSNIHTLFISCNATSGSGLVAFSYSQEPSIVVVAGRSSYSATGGTATNASSYLTISNGTVNYIQTTTNFKFRTNTTYTWVAIGEE